MKEINGTGAMTSWLAPWWLFAVQVLSRSFFLRLGFFATFVLSKFTAGQSRVSEHGSVTKLNRFLADVASLRVTSLAWQPSCQGVTLTCTGTPTSTEIRPTAFNCSDHVTPPSITSTAAAAVRTKGHLIGHYGALEWGLLPPPAPPTHSKY